MGSNKRLREGDRVTIHWDDAWSSEAYWDKTEKKRMLRLYSNVTHGEVWAVDKKSLCLAHETHDSEPDGTGYLRTRKMSTIPRVNITKIERLVVEK